MELIESRGGYFAAHVVCDKNSCVRWHDFNFKPWHVGIFAKTRHGLTLVGVVSAGDGETFMWWANYHDEFVAEICSLSRYSAPDDYDVLPYHGSYRDFMGCVEAAAAFLAEDEDDDNLTNSD